jgi:hypothetical protein
MPIKATPYEHQVKAFNFVCRLFGLVKGSEQSNVKDLPSEEVNARLDLTVAKAGDANEHFQK